MELKPTKTDLVWTIGGEAGNGIMVIGAIFARACSRAGLSVFDYPEYPSLIRGGHNVFQVRAATYPIHSQSHTIDCLVALNKQTIDFHVDSLRHGGVLLYDANEMQLEDKHIKPHLTYLNVPFLQIARDVAGDRIMMNTVALGASAKAMGMDFAAIAGVISDQFKHKGAKVVELDIKCAQAGYDYVVKHLDASKVAVFPKVQKKQRQYVVSGVEAMALGAIKAGMKLYAAYPMTPSTGFLSYFAEIAEECGLVVKQTEDEIAAINMAIGANYAGVRAMAATSGGGFSLMVEGLGLAAMTETPLVIIEGMRGGPSTGLPTWTEQADLLFVRHASQGDFARVVVAPGDVAECFTMIVHAFNLAEQFQIPVIVVIDKYLAESHASIADFGQHKVKVWRSDLFDDHKYHADDPAPRYQVTPSGVSPRLIPGHNKTIFNVASDEHDECGAIDESIENRVAQMDKRMRKLHELQSQIPEPVLYGPKKADLTVLAWGSTKGPVLDALHLAEQQGLSVNFLHLTYLHPFPTDAVRDILQQSKRTLMVEGNYTGQAEAILKQETLHTPDFRYRRYDGRPFYAEDILHQIQQALHNHPSSK